MDNADKLKKASLMMEDIVGLQLMTGQALRYEIRKLKTQSAERMEINTSYEEWVSEYLDDVLSLFSDILGD